MGKHGFPSWRRLTSAAHYRQVFKNNTIKLSDEAFLVLARANKDDEPRLGLAVSKRNIKLATRRNRCKRLVRESFRLSENLPSLDIVFVARRHFNTLSNTEVFKRLDGVWKRLKTSYNV